MKKFTLFLIILIISLSCKQNLKLIPEITPFISEENVFDLKDLETQKKIIKSDSELIIFTPQGKIIRFNPKKKLITFSYNLNFEIEQKIFIQNNLIIFKELNSNTFIIFSLKKNQLIKKLKDIKMDKIIGVDKELIIYVNTDKLIFFNYLSNNILNKTKIVGEKVYNSEFRREKIFILSSNNLFIYNKNKNSLQSLILKNKAASEFLLDNHSIYYGSTKQELISFFIKSEKVKWKFKISKTLRLKPKKIGKYIIITPEDNNIYFFNKNGTLYWWEKFNSTKLTPPLVMKNNICILLMPRSQPVIKFFNYKKKEVISFKSESLKINNPLYLNNSVYILSKNKGNKYITKIGNKYNIEIITDPKDIKPIGKSIKFDLKSINLFKPEFKIKIFNKSKNTVFETKISKKEQPSFVWIPNKAGEYILLIDINSENRREINVNKQLKVIDIKKIIRNIYFKIQRQCKSDLINQN